MSARTGAGEPEIADVIAQCRDHAAWVRRQNATLLETKNISAIEAERRQRLADAAVTGLERYAAGAGPSNEAVPNKIGWAGRGGAFVHLQFGGSWKQHAVLNPAMLLNADAAASTWAGIIKEDLLAVIRRELGK